LIAAEVARQGLTLKRLAFLVREQAASQGGAYSSAHEQLVAKWRAGRFVPNASHLRWLAGALKLPVEMVTAAARAQEDLKSACEVVGDHAGQADALNVTAWIKLTSTSDDAIEHLAKLTSAAAHDHTYQPPTTMLTRVLGIHRQIQALLQGRRHRLRQSRELFRIDAGVLAHVCLLLGDACHDEAAAAYGAVAILTANEAGFSPAEAFSAQAQIARWRHRYTDAVDLAAVGFACSPPTSLRVLLACQEANAAALAGDLKRAREALVRADTAHVDQAPDSAWSCPPARHALYRLSVALHSGDPEAALQEAEVAETVSRPGHPRPFGTWAHTRIAAGIAHLILGSVDGASKQIAPVLELPSDFRLATLTEHMTTMNGLLRGRPFRGAPEAAELRDRIAEFTRSASVGT
jgi:hypothetical protein